MERTEIITPVCEEMMRTGLTRSLSFSVMSKREYLARLIMMGEPQHVIDYTEKFDRFEALKGWAYSLYAGTKYGPNPQWREYPLAYNGHVRVSKGWSPWGYGSHYPIYAFQFVGPDGFMWHGKAWDNGCVRARRYVVQDWHCDHHAEPTITPRHTLCGAA